jgi:lambda repressor-like predicted transcriptional regulator
VSIQPIGAATGLGTSATAGSTATTATVHHHTSLRAVGLTAAAAALGMSVSDLRSALLSGQSLAAVAAAKGVSSETLAVAIPAALMQVDPTLSAARATALAQRMIDSKRTARSRDDADRVEHEHRSGAAMRAAFSAAAHALGMSRNALVGALESGHTLATLATSAGVSPNLTSAIGDAIARADSTLSPDRAAGIARQLVQAAPSVVSRLGDDSD